MKKALFGFIILLPLVLGGVLYGTHNIIIEEERSISLEQAYVAQYPKKIPDMMVDPPIDYGTAF